MWFLLIPLLALVAVKHRSRRSADVAARARATGSDRLLVGARRGVFVSPGVGAASPLGSPLGEAPGSAGGPFSVIPEPPPAEGGSVAVSVVSDVAPPVVTTAENVSTAGRFLGMFLTAFAPVTVVPTAIGYGLKGLVGALTSNPVSEAIANAINAMLGIHPPGQTVVGTLQTTETQIDPYITEIEMHLQTIFGANAQTAPGPGTFYAGDNPAAVAAGRMAASAGSPSFSYQGGYVTAAKGPVAPTVGPNPTPDEYTGQPSNPPPDVSPTPVAIDIQTVEVQTPTEDVTVSVDVGADVF